MSSRMPVRMALRGMLLVSFALFGQVRVLPQQPVRIRLADMVTVLYCQDASSAVTHVCVLSPGGMGATVPGKEGLAYIVGRLALEIPDGDDVREMVAMGSYFRCEVFGDFTLLSAHSLSANFEKTLRVFAENICSPLFSGLRISFIKDQLDFLRKSEEDNPVLDCERLHLLHFFGPAGYGASPFGTPESQKSISKKEIAGFHKVFFNRSTLLLSVVSDLPQDKVVPLLGRAFASLPAGQPSPGQETIPSREASVERAFHRERQLRQTTTSLSLLLPVFSVDNYLYCQLAESLLGKGIGSRLWRIRELRRLAYSVSARSLCLRHGGILSLVAVTSTDRAAEALDAMARELDDLALQGVGEEEWQSTRQVAVNDWLLELENKDRLAFKLAFFEFLGAGCAMVEELPRLFAQADRKGFNDFLKGILDPSKRSLVTVGPAAGR